MSCNGNREITGCHGERRTPSRVIISCGTGGFVDLANMPQNGTALASVTVDTSAFENPMVKIDFSSVLNFNLTMLEELDLIFTLTRTNERGEMTELASWPYTILMDQSLTGAEGEQYVFVILQKTESFNVSYCDQLSCEGNYTYTMRVNSNYFNITSALVQSSLMSATATSVNYK